MIRNVIAKMDPCNSNIIKRAIKKWKNYKDKQSRGSMVEKVI